MCFLTNTPYIKTSCVKNKSPKYCPSCSRTSFAIPHQPVWTPKRATTRKCTTNVRIFLQGYLYAVTEHLLTKKEFLFFLFLERFLEISCSDCTLLFSFLDPLIIRNTWSPTISNIFIQWSSRYSYSLSDPTTLRHHLVTMAIGELCQNIYWTTIVATKRTECNYGSGSWCYWHSFFQQVMQMHSQVWALLLDIKFGKIIWFNSKNQWANWLTNQVTNQRWIIKQ